MSLEKLLESDGIRFTKKKAVVAYGKAKEVYDRLRDKNPTYPVWPDLPVDLQSDLILSLGRTEGGYGELIWTVETQQRIAGWVPSGHAIHLSIKAPLPPSDHVPAKPLDPTRLADQILTTLFVKDNFNTILYSEDEFFVYNGRVWRSRRDKVIFRIVWRAVEKLIAILNQTADSPSSIWTGLVNDVVESIKANRETQKRPGCWLDSDEDTSNIVVFKNGILNLDDFVAGRPDYLQPHTARLFNTQLVQTDFDPLAASPGRTLRFLDELWPNDLECHKLVQEIVGSCLTKPMDGHHFFVVFTGASRGGKGVLCRLMTKIVGQENTAALQLARLPERFALQNAVNKRLLFFSEASWPAEGSAPIQMLNKISARDPVDVDRKNIDPITDTNWGTIVISSNKIPSFLDDSGAVMNRLVLLRFTVSFAGREDTELDGKLAAELPGIILWAIEGWARLRASKGRWTKPVLCQELADCIANNASPIKEWASDYCVFGSGELGAKDKLFRSYQRWCEHRGIPTPIKSQFCARLMEAFPSLKPTRPRGEDGERIQVFQGISLTPDEAEIVDKLNQLDQVQSI